MTLQAGKPNIIVVTVDALRGDRMGFMGYKKKLTPNFDALARDGAWFRHAYSTGTSSPQSFAGIMTSTYPLEYGGYSQIEKPRVLISEVMQRAGYWTAGIHSSPYLSEYFGYDKGWDYFRFASPLPKSGISPGRIKGTVQARILRIISAIHRSLKPLKFLDGIFGILERVAFIVRKIIKDMFHFIPAYFTALELNSEVKGLLKERSSGKPLYLWIHYMDMHPPYALFAHTTGGFLLFLEHHLADVTMHLFSGRVRRLFNPLYEYLYDRSLAHVDRAFGELRNMLEQAGLLRNAVIVITADHGEEFYEHGGFTHTPRLYNENIRVPLILWGVDLRGSIERPVSLIDIAPTIAGLAKTSSPSTYRGKSLFEVSPRDVLSVATGHEADLTGITCLGCAIVAQGHKLIAMRSKDGTTHELFSVNDDGEKRNCAASHSGIVRELTERISKAEYLLPSD